MSRVSERDDAMGDGSADADLAAILHDEAFVESVLRGEADSDGDALAALLSGARAEVVGVPMPGMPSEDELAAALAAGLEQSHGTVTPLRGRRRWFTTVGAGAASVAVLLGGIAVAGHFSGADAPAGHSRQDVVTAASIRDDLDHAQDLLAQGDKAGCLAVLDSTTKKLERLRGNAQFHELDGTRVELWAKATGKPKAQAPTVAQPTTPPTATSTTAPPSATVVMVPPGKPTVVPPPTSVVVVPPPVTTTPAPPATTVPAPTHTATPTPTVVPPSETANPPSSAEPPPTGSPDPPVDPTVLKLSDLNKN